MSGGTTNRRKGCLWGCVIGATLVLGFSVYVIVPLLEPSAKETRMISAVKQDVATYLPIGCSKASVINFLKAHPNKYEEYREFDKKGKESHRAGNEIVAYQEEPPHSNTFPTISLCLKFDKHDHLSSYTIGGSSLFP